MSPHPQEGHLFERVGWLRAAVLGIIGASMSMAAEANALPSVEIPSIGCPEDGQIGAHAAPGDSTETVDLPPALAKRLAFFHGENTRGVLAPRNWHCVGLYGSNGSILLVTPNRLDAKMLLRGAAPRIDGPAIQVTDRVGGTSGRFDVAEVIARVFPERRPFVDRVIAEGIYPATEFPTGPYPADHLARPGRDIVTFVTPANTEGLGTKSRLRPGPIPIRGAAILYGQTPDLLLLDVRLPSGSEALGTAIIERIERDGTTWNGGD